MLSMAPATECSHCKAADVELKPCPCLQAFYCNRTCQVAHWKKHITTCTIAGKGNQQAKKEEGSRTSSQQNNSSASLGTPASTHSAYSESGREPSTFLNGQLVNPDSASVQKMLGFLSHLLFSVPQPVVANALLAIAEEQPSIGDLMCQRLDRAVHDFHSGPQHFAPPPPGMPMHHAHPHYHHMAAPHHHAPQPQPQQQQQPHMHAMQQWPAGSKGAPHSHGGGGRGPRNARGGGNATDLETCAKHNITRSKKHLQMAGAGGWECVMGFHCLESSTPAADEYDIPQTAQQAQVPTGIPES